MGIFKLEEKKSKWQACSLKPLRLQLIPQLREDSSKTMSKKCSMTWTKRGMTSRTGTSTRMAPPPSPPQPLPLWSSSPPSEICRDLENNKPEIFTTYKFLGTKSTFSEIRLKNK